MIVNSLTHRVVAATASARSSFVLRKIDGTVPKRGAQRR